MSRSVTDYSMLSDLEHIYVKSDTYIGSDQKNPTQEWLYDDENKKVISKECDLPEGVKRLFLEIISNAGDNCENSRNEGIDPEKIEITVTPKRIIVKNYGIPIPLKKAVLKKKKGGFSVEEYHGEGDFVWFPVVIFGKLRSSNNYDKENTNNGDVAGRNGYGAKLANIFSKFFQVRVCDPNEGIIFDGKWKDNMFRELDEEKRLPEVEITPTKEKKGFVEITYELDFARFQMKEYTPDYLAVIKKMSLDYSFTRKIKIIYNGETFDFRSIKEYSKLYWNEEELNGNTLTAYKWREGTPESITNAAQKVKEKKIMEAKEKNHVPEIEILILDTPDDSKCISFVNGLITIEGGTHVDGVCDPLIKHICHMINGRKKKNEQRSTINKNNVVPHLSFIICANFPDTYYSSQSKTKLTKPKVSFKYSKSDLEKVKGWEIINRLNAELEAIAYKSASETDGKKKKNINAEKGEDANKAGTKESSKCSLFIAEGESAISYPRKRIDHIKDGKNYYGLIPLKGKFLNVSKARPDKYANNLVIASLKHMLGLQEGLDYTLEHNLEKLRYGFIIIAVDADDDGMHILASLLNFFREKFPGLLKQNMIGYLRTPMVKVFKKGKILHRFFKQKAFDEWYEREGKNNKNYEITYYKGLGTSDDDDIKDDMKTAPTIICFYDDDCEKNFDIAFEKVKGDVRKKWISERRDNMEIDDILSVDIKEISNGGDLISGQDISQFLNRELVTYSVRSLFRAIPSKWDLLKDSQRKTLYAALIHFKYDPNSGSPMKTARFAAKSADMMQYHHGEKSLCDTIIKMAQDFTGSNIFGFFKQKGQFGSRHCGGKGAADPRYSFVHLSWWIPFVYDKEIVEAVPKNIIEGESAEPFWIPGIIPMGVVNGTYGIATGFSTATTSYHPLEVIDWYIERCNGREGKILNPFFNGFTGKSVIINKDDKSDKFTITSEDNDHEEKEILPGSITSLKSPKRIREIDIDNIDEDEEVNKENLAIFNHTKNCKYTLQTFGKMEIRGTDKKDNTEVHITELPIKTWTRDYLEWIKDEVSKKDRFIVDFNDFSTTEKPYFQLFINRNHPTKSLNNYNDLHLTRKFGISNITLIDEKGIPEKFETIKDVMEIYYVNMIKHLSVVRENRIKNEELKVKILNYKRKFITAVLEKKIVIIQGNEDDIKEKMKEMKIPHDIYEKSKSKEFSIQQIEKIDEQIKEAERKLSIAKSIKVEDIWIDKLEILRKEFKKRYKRKKFVRE